jgi:hypothetical protein
MSDFPMLALGALMLLAPGAAALAEQPPLTATTGRWRAEHRAVRARSVCC